MKKKVYLHIGFSKTGTTAIQDIILANENRLVAEGYRYIKTLRRNDGVNHHPLAIILGMGREEYQPHPKWQHLLQSVFNEIGNTDFDNYIISTELLTNTFPKSEFRSEFNEFITRLSPKIILYVRNQFDWLVSWYQQRAKHANVSTNISDYFGDLKTTQIQASCDFYSKIKYYENIVGKENIIIDSYDDKKQILAKDFFLKIHFKDYASLSGTKKTSNKSPTAHALHLQVALSKYNQLKPGQFREFTNQIAKPLQHIELKPHITKAFAESVTSYSKKINEKILDRYGVDLNTPLVKAVENAHLSQNDAMQENIDKLLKEMQVLS